MVVHARDHADGCELKMVHENMLFSCLLTAEAVKGEGLFLIFLQLYSLIWVEMETVGVVCEDMATVGLVSGVV